MHIHAKGWNGESPTISVSSTGVTFSPSSFTVTGDSSISGSGASFTVTTDSATDYFTLTLSGVDSEKTITLDSGSGKKKRFVVWGVNAE